VKPETPVDREKEAEEKKQKARLREAIVAGMAMVFALLGIFLLLVGCIWLLSWIFLTHGPLPAGAVLLFSVFVVIGIKFGYDWYQIG